MHTSGTNQPSLTPINYISSTGSRKILSPDNSVKTVCLSLLNLYKCQKCHYVHEKPLQTRCCETFLCASCYMFPYPKKCPTDGKKFNGIFEEDLKPAGSLVNRQIELLIDAFNDVEVIGLEDQKSTYQKDTLNHLESSSSQKTAGETAKTYKKGAFDSSVIPKSHYNVTYSSKGNKKAGGTSFLALGGGFTIQGSGIGFDNNTIVTIRDGRVVSGDIHRSTINFSPAAQPDPVKTFDFESREVECIYVGTNAGSIFIEKHDNQEKISITSSTQPTCTSKKLSLSCNQANVSLKIPESYTGQLHLVSNAGDIETCEGCRITSGGKIATNCGSMNLVVNSEIVDAIATTSMGSKDVQLSRQQTDGKRQRLIVDTNVGKINIRD